jgi:hypothetical protein
VSVTSPTDLELGASALAPWEGTQPLAFAVEALTQLSAELTMLQAALCADSDGPLDDKVISRAVAGLAHRAEAAAEIAQRLTKTGTGGAQ